MKALFVDCSFLLNPFSEEFLLVKGHFVGKMMDVDFVIKRS